MVLKCYCPLTFTFNYLSFLLLFLFFSCIFFLPKYHEIIFKKVQVAMGSGTGLSSEFSGQINFTWFTWLCSFFYFIYGLKDLTNAFCKVVCDYTTVQGRWFHMGGYVQFMYEWVKCSSHKTSLCICCRSILSLVQIFFSFVSNSLSCYYHTLPYPKTKEKKIWTKDKIEPQHIHLIKKRRLTVFSRKVYFVETFRDDAFQKRLKVSWWYAPTLTCARHIRDLHS